MGFIVGVGGHVFDTGLSSEPLLNHTRMVNAEVHGIGLFHHHTAESYGWHFYML